MTKIDVSILSSCVAFQSLVGSPLGPLLLNIFVDCSLYLISIRTQDLPTLFYHWIPQELGLPRRKTEHHLEVGSLPPTGRKPDQAES